MAGAGTAAALTNGNKKREVSGASESQLPECFLVLLGRRISRVKGSVCDGAVAVAILQLRWHEIPG